MKMRIFLFPKNPKVHFQGFEGIKKHCAKAQCYFLFAAAVSIRDQQR